MILYEQFYGNLLLSDIGKTLRDIAKKKSNFKILTGYGSSVGISKSKNNAIKSLLKMKKEKLIKGFFPGEVKNMILDQSKHYYDDKISFENLVKNDPDYGNEGIIFIFV